VESVGADAAAGLIDLQFGGEFDLCIDMRCPRLVKPPGCDPATCAQLMIERKRRGAVYMVRADGEGEDFLGLLPRVRRA